MARRDLSTRDASSYAASELDYIIKRGKSSREPEVKTVTAEEAMNDERVFRVSSTRDVTRVLFISRNTELLNPTKQTLDGYVDISDLFDEVHILILRQGIPPKNPVLRVWWQTPKAALKVVEEQLQFASGFRPDLIVARDAFESAVTAYKLGEKYGRPTQLHVLDDYSSKEFSQKSRHNFWRSWLPRFTIPRFTSVRTLTDTVRDMLQKKFDIPDLDVLPRYQNYEELIDLKPTLDLKEKYKPFVFTLLFVGNLGHDSLLYRAMDAARFVLRNPRVGLIVLGDGPARGEFQKRARLLEIEKQVVFETKVQDIVPYLKSANILIVTDIDAESEELVLKGAAAGIPMIMARTEKREDIFTHEESAFICDIVDGQDLTDRIDDLLNDINLRKQFVERGQEMILDKFHSDPLEYLESYRTSIEQAFFVGGEETGEETDET